MTKLTDRIKKIDATVFVFILAFLYRLPNLAAFVNDDDSLWKLRGYMFSTAMTGLKFAETAITYHPGVPLMWSQMIAIKIFGALDDLVFHGSLIGRELFEVNHIIQNGLLIFFTSILIALVFYLIRKLLGEFVAIIFVLFLLTEPFYTALARSIHNDLLLGTFMFLSFVAFYLVLTKTSSKKNFFKDFSIYLPGIFGGLAVLTKSTALFMFPMIILMFVYFLFLNRADWKKYSKLTAIYFLSLVATFFIVWPSMWTNAGYTLYLYFYKGIFDTAINDGHAHYWFGKDTMDPGWLYYPIVVYGRISPCLFLGFFGGMILLAKKVLKNIKDFKKININHFYILNIIFFFALFVMFSITSKKLDRYILPLIYPMAVMTVYFVHELFLKFGKKVIYITLGLIFMRIIVMGIFHPNYLAYYSPLIGGPDIGKNIIEPKWVVGFDKVASYLNEVNRSVDHRLIVVTPDAHLLSYLADFKTMYPETDNADKEGEYYVVPEFKKRSADYMRSKFHLTEENMVKEIKIAYITYYKIYKR